MDHGRRWQNLAKRMIRATAVWLAFVTICARPCFAQQQGEPLRPEWCGQLPRPEYKTLHRVDSADPWFEIYEIREGVFAIYEPHQFEEVISYLILGNRHALLFDTGLGIGNISRVVAKLTSLPVIVLNSHTHFDHTGGNAEFSHILDPDTPFTRKNSEGQSNVYSRDALAPGRICGQLPPGVRPESYSIRPFKISEWVKDGEHIDLGERNLEVIFTPGHTPDSLCLFDRKNGLLFTGDTFYRGPIYLFTPETNVAAYGRSVDRIAKLAPEVKLLLPSHNIPVADPEYLNLLVRAVHEIDAGNLKPTVSQGRREYSFQGFSLLLAPN
jgi:glyoxylase-like metal-dependent hydrolase (beta-lactamase superfamily II)